MSKRRPPRLLVDLAPLTFDGSNGAAGVFVLRLLAELLNLPNAPDLHLLVKPEGEPAIAPLLSAGAVLHRLGEGDVEEPRRPRRLRRRLPWALRAPIDLFLPDRASLRRLGADILFSPLGTAAFHEPGLPHLAIAHDFQELTYPEFFDIRERRRRRAFRADLRRADRVIAVSKATRDEAVRKVGIAVDRVSVLPPVVGQPRRPLSPDELTRRLQALDLGEGAYAVYPANFWPHKNHERLVEAAAELVRRDASFRLVLCGALEKSRERVRDRVERLGLVPAVRVLRYLDPPDVTALLQGARLLVFPSLFEGFGLPVLEAMALGTPVACSDLSALRELAADAACFFDPRDDDAIASTVDVLWRDAETRADLSGKGRARAELHGRIDTAGAYLELLEAAGEMTLSPLKARR